MIKNFGLIIPDIETREQGAEHILGSSAIDGPVINPTGDWSPYLPDKEPQSKRGIETQGCTNFGTNNAIETLLNFKGFKANYSDRYLAICSDTDPYRGNDPHKVAETLRKSSGCLSEERLPFSDDLKTVEEFYTPRPMSSDLLKEGNKWYNEWELAHDWIFKGGTPQEKREKLKEALTKGTVCVSVLAWVYDNQRNFYTKKVGEQDSHWCQLVAVKDDRYIVFDSYDGFIKELDPLYDFNIAKVYYLNPAKPKLDWFQSIIDFIKNLVIPSLTKQVEAVIVPDQDLPPPAQPPMNPKPKYLWDNPVNVRHSCRVIMDEYSLAWKEKDLLCACIEQESGFNPKAIGKPNKNGTQDFGLCQFNNGKNKQGVPYWIGPGADFKDTDEVLNDPEKNVRVMIREYKKGNLKLWSSYSTGAYKKYL